MAWTEVTENAVSWTETGANHGIFDRHVFDELIFDTMFDWDGSAEPSTVWHEID